MTCEDQHAAFVERYNFHQAADYRNQLTVCAGCGGLLRSVESDGRWTWRHPQEVVS